MMLLPADLHVLQTAVSEETEEIITITTDRFPYRNNKKMAVISFCGITAIIFLI